MVAQKWAARSKENVASETRKSASSDVSYDGECIRSDRSPVSSEKAGTSVSDGEQEPQHKRLRLQNTVEQSPACHSTRSESTS